ncbi:MAG: Aspartyl/glutamyl-tRNA(Asn/Gln) amidotransferase subunit B [Alphaproteobacteria bacterium MarineAlpha4_Bin2]|nr:MAG: Aspartyl/glutamyl-tRNA(Asn/Gln) amidotransferase subunit B [Alphaproteobacteria bacterium MarineAlpha4_Bin2]
MAALLRGSSEDWEVVIGLEVHAQVSTNAKLFSGAPTAFGGEPNTQVSIVDAAMPGMLPVLNRTAVREAVRTGLALNADINQRSIFARKNYFYPDLPSGYQISQYEAPIVGKGEIEIDMPDGTTKRIGIERLHLEQDAGKSIHDRHPSKTYIDLNRSGVPLMEIVSQPDMRSSEEAGAYVEKLRAILRYLGSCDGNMQEGSLRVDANVSVRRPGENLGTRCEIKNVNSIRFLKQAIEYEAHRQIEIIEGGGTIDQETRLFDPNRGETRSMRSKEDAHDYRYFPDPDLLPIDLDGAFIEALQSSLPELPDQRKQRLADEYGLSAYDAGILVSEKETADFFEIVASGRDAKQAANWVTRDLFARLNKADLVIAESPVSAAAMGELLDLLSDGTISGRIAKNVFDEMFDSRKSATAIVEEKGLKQITNTGELENLVEDIIKKGADQAEQYRAGNTKVLGWFVGQIMKETQGKANPQTVNELLRKKLSG